GSFAGLRKFYETRKPPASLKDVKQELLKLESYYSFFPARRRFKRRKVVVHFANFQFCSDLIDLNRYLKFNKPYRYIIVFLDCFSRKLYAYPLSSKQPKNIVAAFKKLFRQLKKPFFYLQTDLGTEYTSKETQNFLKKKNIIWFNTYSEIKASLCERVIATLMQKFQRMFTHRKSLNWKSSLTAMVSSYNTQIHRSLKLSPNDASKEENNDIVWKALYEKYIAEPVEKPVYFPEQRIRISLNKKTFDKGYSRRFSNEVFEIARVLDTQPPTYIIKDDKGEEEHSTKTNSYQREMDEINSLYITLTSSTNAETSPSNFINNIATPIKLDEGVHEIGLTEITYEPCNSIFGFEEGDNIILVQSDYESKAIFSIVKEQSLASDITLFNRNCKEGSIPIEIQQMSIKRQIYYRIVIKYAGDIGVKLSENFRTILGFENEIYHSQSNLGEKPMNLPVYNNLPSGTLISFEVVDLPQITRLVLDEPTEYTPEGFASMKPYGLLGETNAHMMAFPSKSTKRVERKKRRPKKKMVGNGKVKKKGKATKVARTKLDFVGYGHSKKRSCVKKKKVKTKHVESPGEEDVSIRSSFFQKCFPIGNLEDVEQPIEFTASGSPGVYYDLKNSFLYTTLKVTKNDGTNIADANDVAVANFIGSTLIKKLDLFINQELISSSNNYNYVSYLKSLLSYPINYKNNELRESQYYFDDSPNTSVVANSSYKKRKDIIKFSKLIEVVTPILDDLFLVNKLFHPGFNIKLKIERASSEFCLVSSIDTVKYGLTQIDVQVDGQSNDSSLKIGETEHLLAYHMLMDTLGPGFSSCGINPANYMNGNLIFGFRLSRNELSKDQDGKLTIILNFGSGCTENVTALILGQLRSSVVLSANELLSALAYILADRKISSYGVIPPSKIRMFILAPCPKVYIVNTHEFPGKHWINFHKYSIDIPLNRLHLYHLQSAV
ncbi:putative uncharacterized transposon-derived protein F54H12.3, partial [Orchesella cincta]